MTSTAARALAACALALASGCGHMSTLRPTPKGQVQAELAVGGPFARISNAPIPIPLSTVGARYGFHERADVHAHFHPTAAALGVMGLDVGGSLLALQQDGAVPDVTATARVYGFTDFKAFRPYLQVSGVVSWKLWGRVAPFFGADALVQFGASPLFALGAGLQAIFGRAFVQAEAKWFGVGHDTRYMVVEWLGPANVGAMGVVLGFGVRFGDAPAPPAPKVLPPAEPPSMPRDAAAPPPAAPAAPAVPAVPAERPPPADAPTGPPAPDAGTAPNPSENAP